MGYPCVRLLACGAGSNNICFRSGDLDVCLQGGGGSIDCRGQQVQYVEAVPVPQVKTKSHTRHSGCQYH